MATVAAQLAALKKQQEALLRKEQALKAKAHDKVLAKIVQLANDAGLSASEIAKALNVGKPAKAKTSKAPKAAKKTGKVAPKYRIQQIMQKHGQVVVYRLSGLQNSKHLANWNLH